MSYQETLERSNALSSKIVKLIEGEPVIETVLACGAVLSFVLAQYSPELREQTATLLVKLIQNGPQAAKEPG
jgi:hypothetical protein